MLFAFNGGLAHSPMSVDPLRLELALGILLPLLPPPRVSEKLEAVPEKLGTFIKGGFLRFLEGW